MPQRSPTESLRAEVEAVLAERLIPSLSLHIRTDNTRAFHYTSGMARLDPPQPAATDQPYDLASLTKALVASTVAASLIEAGDLTLDMKVNDVLPSVDPRITLAQLLTHSSGLPKWNAFYTSAQGAWGTKRARDLIVQGALNTECVATPGARHTYTDVGFLVLLALLERVGARRLDALFADLICAPADAHDLSWGWPESAATELCPVRGTLIQGTVHDLNCASMGGVSSHAGLFGTAQAVAELSDTLRRAVADPTAHPNLPGRTLGELWTLRGPGSHVGGWDTITRGGYTSTGAHFPDDCVGHLGYTGTSLWLSPSRKTVVVLLSNRGHPVDDLTAIRAARPRLHDAVARFLGWTLPTKGAESTNA
ncbi:MAG: CubicO group peptidase (beta-lactamase class C family) [Kiritimatiellia bacterium]|jgi:CubicO group peptidase (beta-lactamase class C family)